MTITPLELERRRKHLGSSDMATVLGLNQYKTPYELWLDKSGKLEPEKQSLAAKTGQRFESAVLEWAQSELGSLVRNQRRVLKGTPISANLDALLVADQVPVEAKTSGLFSPLSHEWGTAETDEVPDVVKIQVHVQMMCVGAAEVAHVPAFLGGRGFQMFHVPRNPRLCEIILERAAQFWRLVTTDTPPEKQEASRTTLKVLRRVPKKVVAVSQELVDRWLKTNETKKRYTAAHAEAELALLRAFGDAEAAVTDDGRAVTFFPQKRKAHEVQASEYRVFRYRAQGLPEGSPAPKKPKKARKKGPSKKEKKHVGRRKRKGRRSAGPRRTVAKPRGKR